MMYDMNDYFTVLVMKWLLTPWTNLIFVQLNCRSNIRLTGNSVIRIIYKETRYLQDMYKYDAVHLWIG